MAGSEIRVSRVLAGPPDIVWRALTESALIAEWLMPNDFKPEVGHTFTMRTKPGPGFDGVVNAEVLELEPEQRMVWKWVGGPIDTTVEFTLEPEGDGTRLTVRQAEFRGFKAKAVSAILYLGWRKILGSVIPGVLAKLRAE